MLSPNDSSKADGPVVFVVEDETLVALNLEDILHDLGCRVIGPAMKLETAEKMVLDGMTIDLAILDVNVGGKPVFPVAKTLSDRGVPIVFATGYGRAGLPDDWSKWPVLQKPYSMEDVAGILPTTRATP